MKNKDRYFMKLAIKNAVEGAKAFKGGPFGAVVVKDGVVVAEACNEVTSTNDPTSHAEMLAIRRACHKLGTFQLDGCVIYTSCEPCPMCLGAIYWARPARVVYASTKDDAREIGFDDDFIYEELELEQHKRKIKFTQIMKKTAQKAFNVWKTLKDKIPY